MPDLQFTPKINLVLERHKFFSRMQNAEEDIASYVATLHGLALSCLFEQLSDSLIRDLIVRCAYNKKIREKLLMKDPNLEEAIQIAKAMEHTAVWLLEMDGSNKEGNQNIVNEIRDKSKLRIGEMKKKSTRNCAMWGKDRRNSDLRLKKRRATGFTAENRRSHETQPKTRLTELEKRHAASLTEVGRSQPALRGF
ncbi:hypothetical protein NDU88_009776 [Pleurodeles waltl]|uniref:Uncharacterized protein n=1 Tax=Pleurodeles waltl TaxID=8319 RepID=A0AAV7QTT0_PLEWA|nr:hypothetical protein NDU88_009776 [Pleurodeles waltl]